MWLIRNASCEELIEITHEDSEWIRLSKNTYDVSIMNLEQNINNQPKTLKLFQNKLDDLLKECRIYQDKYRIDEQRIVHMTSKEILDLNPKL